MNASLLSLNRNKWGSIRYQEAIRMVYTTLPVSGIGIQIPCCLSNLLRHLLHRFLRSSAKASCKGGETMRVKVRSV